MPRCMWRGQGTTLGNCFSLSAIWVLKVALLSSALVAGAFTPGATLSARVTVCVMYLPTVSVSQSGWSLPGLGRLSVSIENMSRWRRKAGSW